MVDSFFIILPVSIILGFLAGIGIGGGSLLLLWLTMVIGMPQSSAKIVNLFFFLPSAIVSTIIRRKEGALQIKRLIPTIIAGCVCAGIFTILSRHIHADLLKKGFGILLLGTGIKELFYNPRKENQRDRKAR